ncbi:MAG: hypothetical protein ACKOAR_01875 [Bacteroidota bacterium]
MATLSERQRKQVTDSFFNVMAMFPSTETIRSTHAKCLIRWALQLGLKADDISAFDRTSLKVPESRTEKIRSAFHLVYMICLDHRIEDAELELARAYAERIGLNATVIAGLFQSITTAEYDELDPDEMENQIVGFFEQFVD